MIDQHRVRVNSSFEQYGNQDYNLVWIHQPWVAQKLCSDNYNREHVSDGSWCWKFYVVSMEIRNRGHIGH